MQTKYKLNIEQQARMEWRQRGAGVVAYSPVQWNNRGADGKSPEGWMGIILYRGLFIRFFCVPLQ